MLQFYFLAIVCTGLGGAYLAFEDIFHFGDRFDKQQKDSFLQIFGFVCVFVGLVKLFVVAGGFVIIGDLLPALASIFCGVCFLLDYYREYSQINLNVPGFVDFIATSGRKYLGYVSLAACFLHFFFPTVSVF
ncbi:MAG: hypothetical protein MJ183_00240 [Treponemataceae bacterium]|nr:hypothetical protein [Treponemataceae bacterium]